MQPRSPEPFDPSTDLAACRELLRRGSKSFSAASMLLPREVCDSATVLYAFCREADDAVDLRAGGIDAVAGLRDRLDHIYAGTPRDFSTDRAMARVVARYALPRALLDALIEGFEWDAHGRRYATMVELEAYAARVAGTIGAMMAVLMGVRAPSALARACDLGVAMQLTNIARDVGEDARAGRIYLPLDRLHDAGVDADRWLADPQINAGIRRVVRELLQAADSLYAGVESGVAQLPSACRPGINAARLIYAEIGRVIRHADCDSVSRRAFVPAPRKAWLLLKSFTVASRRSSGEAAPPLPGTRYLVDAVSTAGLPLALRSAELPPAFPWWQFKSRALWLIDLFERMERRERMDTLPATAQQLSGP